MRPLTIARLAVRDVRNLESVDLEPGPRFNVIHGDNGQGKTNLVEAIYCVATSRSFRTARIVEMLRRGKENEKEKENASVRAVVVEDGMQREQSVGISQGVRVLRIDGNRPKSSAMYAAKTPIVVFSPSSLTLTMGSSRERRTLLDRVALYTDAASLDAVSSYQRALRERQRALEERGTRARDLEDWEELVVRHGLDVMTARDAAASAVLTEARRAFERIAARAVDLVGEYVASAPRDAAEYRSALERSRPRDVKRRSASIGPHRDDLSLVVANMPARTTASQGQHRALVLALKAAELAVIGRARDVHPILLLDDVSSELDAERTHALFAFLAQQRGQVFLTTTRPELIPRDLGDDDSREHAKNGRVDFRIVAGSVTH